MDGATTQWEKASISFGTAKYLRGTFTMWSRLMNGEQFFTALPNSTEPVNSATVGYHGIADALKAAGLSYPCVGM